MHNKRTLIVFGLLLGLLLLTATACAGLPSGSPVVIKRGVFPPGTRLELGAGSELVLEDGSKRSFPGGGVITITATTTINFETWEIIGRVDMEFWGEPTAEPPASTDVPPTGTPASTDVPSAKDTPVPPTHTPEPPVPTDEPAAHVTVIRGAEFVGNERRSASVDVLMSEWGHPFPDEEVEDWQLKYEVYEIELVKDSSGLSVVLPPGLSQDAIEELYDIVGASSINYVTSDKGVETGHATFQADYCRVHLYNWGWTP